MSSRWRFTLRRALLRVRKATLLSPVPASKEAHPRFASPLYPVGDLSSDERLRRNKALWKEQRTFMSALKAQRKLRIDAEDRGAAALQRMWRGFQLRRW